MARFFALLFLLPIWIFQMADPAEAESPIRSTLGQQACAATLRGQSPAEAGAHIALRRQVALSQAQFVSGEMSALDLNAFTHAAILADPMTAHLVLGIGFGEGTAADATHALRRMLGAAGTPAELNALRETEKRLELDGDTPRLEPDPQLAYETALAETLSAEAYGTQIVQLTRALAGQCANSIEQYYLGAMAAQAFGPALGYGAPGSLAGTSGPVKVRYAEKVLPAIEGLGAPLAMSALAYLVRYGLESYLAGAEPKLTIPPSLAGRLPNLEQAFGQLSAEMPLELERLEAEMFQ